jgi:uncharacterized protein (DUF433 family)
MTADQQNRIVLNPAVLAGKPSVKGTRISVEHVLDHLASGWTIAAVLENYPSLSEKDIVACLAYARDVVAGEAIIPTAA